MSNISQDSSASVPRELKGKKLIGYSVGSLGLILPFSMIQGYSFQFYVYTVGLDAFLTSIGMLIGLTLYAVCAPIFGVISDNKKPTNKGKRRPFLLYGLGLFIFLGVFIWTPPKCPIGQPVYWPTALYYWTMMAAYNIAIVSIFSPYMAMIPEQCETESNRVLVSSIQGLGNVLGTVLGILLPMILQSQLVDPTHAKWWEPSGAYLIAKIPFVGLILSALGAFMLTITYISVDESFFLKTSTPTNGASIPKKNVAESFQQMFAPAKNPKYRFFLYETIFASMGIRILMTGILPFMTYKLLFVGNQFILFMLLEIPFAFGGFVLWAKVIPKKGLVGGYMLSLLLQFFAFMAVLLLLANIGLLTQRIISFILVAVGLACIVGGFLFPTPITSALVDEDAEKLVVGEGIDKRQQVSALSGAYFGIYSFIMNIASGLANLVLGAVYIGANAENPLFITISLPLAGVFMLIAWLFMRPVKLNKKVSNGEKK